MVTVTPSRLLDGSEMDMVSPTELEGFCNGHNTLLGIPFRGFVKAA